MARPMKKGLDFFNRPVGWLHTKEMRKLMRACGPASVAVIDEVDCLIYGQEGYYLQWDDDVQFDVADAVGVKESTVAEVISKAVEIGLYVAGEFTGHAVLTNADIQEHYRFATKNRKGPKPTLYWINDDINSINDSSNAGDGGHNPHSKEKDSKEQDSTVQDSTPQRQENLTLESLLCYMQSTPPASRNLTEGERAIWNAYLRPLEDYYSQYIGRVTPAVEMHLDHWSVVIDRATVGEALKIMFEAGKDNWAYAEGVLNNWLDDGVRSHDDWVKKEAMPI